MKRPYATLMVGLVASVVVLRLPVPGYLRAFLLLSMQHWLSPFAVYFGQRMAAYPRIESISPADPSLPAAHLQRVARPLSALKQAGFVELGWIRNSDRSNPVCVLLVLLQHPETSDIAHLLVAGPASGGRGVSNSSLWFSRARFDGSRIRTGSFTLRSPFPPPPQDSVLGLKGVHAPLDVWGIHQLRVSGDRAAVRNALVTNALAFQLDLEAKGVDRQVQSGYWRRDPGQTVLRPTPSGALKMTLRMLFPWKQIASLRERLMLRRLAPPSA